MRGVGETALETMFEARTTGGKFRDLFDLATRVDAKRLNKGVLESLVQCGAFDTVLEPAGITRARAYAAVDRALERPRNADDGLGHAKVQPVTHTARSLRSHSGSHP